MQTTFTAIPVETARADILLIYPDFAKNELGTASYPENHLGLNRLASYLDQKGYSVKVLNTTGGLAGTKGPEDLAAYLRENKDTFTVLGFHANSWNISHIIRILKLLKDDLAERLVLFGGPLPTAEPEKVTRLFSDLGYTNIGLVQGYGELALEKIMQKPDAISEVDGVWSMRDGRLVKGTLQRLSDEEMASLPMLNPRFNTFYQLFYRPYLENAAQNPASAQSMDTIYTAQGLDVNHGCPFNCSYCSVHIFGHSVSEYPPARVCDELEYLAKETGFFMFTFTNSNLLFLRRDWVISFCEEIIKRKMEHYLSWSGYHHPNTINLLSVEDFRLLKKAGCDQIVVGIQSVDPKVLELFNRPANTYKTFKEIVTKTQEAGLELVIDYIRGVPGENLTLVEEFYDYCIGSKIEMREFLLKIYPNTALAKKKLDLTDYELVPITGDLAGDLDSYTVIPKKDDPRNIELSRKIQVSNRQIAANRKIRLGQNYVTSPSQAKELKDKTIPQDPHIPPKVKTAMVKLLDAMLNPPAKTDPLLNLSPQEMMKRLIMADESAPPVVKAMQDKLRRELGEEKFASLKEKFSKH
jgi:radical SAM superfamily enzyme YgiQ (UPF0313 family)